MSNQLYPLHYIGLSKHAWLTNYLYNSPMCSGGWNSSFLDMTKGLPQGSVLGLILFLIYINNHCNNLSNAMYNLYADDTIMYCCSTPVTQAFEFLQATFYVTQSRLNDLQLVLNTDKIKLMVFSHTKVLLQTITNIVISKGQPIKCVLNYRYLGFNSMRKFILKHINNLLIKLWSKLLSKGQTKINDSNLPTLDYGGVLYLSVPSLDTVFHLALRFVTGCSLLLWIVHELKFAFSECMQVHTLVDPNL